MITTIALGRLVDAPVLHTTPNNKTVCKFRIACDRGAFDGTDFISIETWRGAEANHDKLVKGQLVQVTGKLRTSEWKDEDGNPRSRTFINADDIVWLAKPGANKPTDEEAAV